MTMSFWSSCLHCISVGIRGAHDDNGLAVLERGPRELGMHSKHCQLSYDLSLPKVLGTPTSQSIGLQNSGKKTKQHQLQKKMHAGVGAWQKEFLSVPNLPSLVLNVLVLFLNSTCRCHLLCRVPYD